jgi:hypothetical protein
MELYESNNAVSRGKRIGKRMGRRTEYLHRLIFISLVDEEEQVKEGKKKQPVR